MVTIIVQSRLARKGTKSKFETPYNRVGSGLACSPISTDTPKYWSVCLSGSWTPPTGHPKLRLGPGHPQTSPTGPKKFQAGSQTPPASPGREESGPAPPGHWGPDFLWQGCLGSLIGASGSNRAPKSTWLGLNCLRGGAGSRPATPAP